MCLACRLEKCKNAGMNIEGKNCLLTEVNL